MGVPAMSMAPVKAVGGDPAGPSVDEVAPKATEMASSSNGGWFQQAYDVAKENPYFHAGAGLYAMTIGAVIGRTAMTMASNLLQRKYIVSLETTNRDASYQWLMQWMGSHKTFSFRQMSLITSNVTIHANEEVSSSTTFVPSPNIPHFLMHNGWPVIVYRKRQVERAAGSDVLEILEMKTLGTTPTVMHDIVEQAKTMAADKDSDKTVIYQNAGGRWIRQQDARPRRPLGSVILEGSMRTELLQDVEVFLGSSTYYRNLGVPYRRGYLLHGPPGCGKSSLVMALAGELRLAICLLSLSNRNLDDESLNSLLNSAPLRSIVLMEDIDRAFTNDSRVTMSGLLNALDGVAAQEGRLVFMTTNHVERLDAALIRPGRADVKLMIGLVSKAQAAALFAKFFPDATNAMAFDFASEIPDRRISVAQLQSHLFLHRNSAVDAVAKLPAMVKSVMDFETNIQEARKRDQRQAERMHSLPTPPSLF